MNNDVECITMMKVIYMNYPRSQAIVLQAIVDMGGCDEYIETTNKELLEEVEYLNRRDLYRCLFDLKQLGVIEDKTSKKHIRTIKIIDKDILDAYSGKKKTVNREKKDFTSKIPQNIMQHVIALKEIRERKNKNTQ